jgi:transcriptional regulator with XRE-family HTH domain
MKSDESIHGADIDGDLPSSQLPRAGGYPPPTDFPRSCDESARPMGTLVAHKKRPTTYTAVQAEIGKRIKWARELVEPNRAAFARVLGVDRSTIQKIEDGDRAPSVFNIIDIAHRLRVSPDYILTGSLRGVDGELAGLLVALHPELADSYMGRDDGTCSRPKRPKQA